MPQIPPVSVYRAVRAQKKGVNRPVLPVNTSAIQIEFNQPPPELTRNSSKCTFEFRAEILSLSRKSLYYCRLSLFSPCSTVYISISCPYLVYKKYIVEFLCSHFIRPAPHPPNRIGMPHSLRSFPCSLFSSFAATGRAGSPSFLLFGRRPEIRRSASVTAQAVRPEDRPPASEKPT